MGTRIPVQGYTRSNNDDNNDNDNDNLRSADSYIEGNLNQVRDGDGISDVDREAVTQDSLDHDEGSNTVSRFAARVKWKQSLCELSLHKLGCACLGGPLLRGFGDCLDESYKNAIEIRTVVIDDDRSSLDSCGSLRSCCNTLTVKDLLPIETAKARFLQIILDHFITEHVIEKRGTSVDNHAEPVEDKFNKRKSGEVQYEGDPRFVLPLMYVANLYETLVNEANVRIASLNGLRDKTIGVALEASGGLYRKLTQKYPKTGSYSFKRRELATSLETRTRFPELVVQEEKRVRFVVANGLDIVEKPNSMPADDAEWFKRLTGRSEVGVTSRDYKFYNPRHKVRRASLNASPTIACLPSYPSSNDQDIHSVESPRELETPSKQPMVSMARQPHFEPVIVGHHQPLNQNQHTTLLSRTHESAEPSHLPDIAHAHQSSTLGQNLGSLQPLTGSHVVAHPSMMPSSPAKFCDECGSPYLRPTSKFCSQCGTKRFGI